MGSYYTYFTSNLANYYSYFTGDKFKAININDKNEGLLSNTDIERSKDLNSIKNQYKLLKYEEFDIKEDYENSNDKDNNFESLRNEIKEVQIDFGEDKNQLDQNDNLEDLKKQILIEKTEDFDI